MRLYRSALALLVGLLALGTTPFSRADDKDDAIKKDLEALKGTWVLESGERNGGEGFPDAFTKDFKFVFDGTKLTIVLPGSELKTTFTIDPSQKPKHMDITTENKVVSPAIYSIEKDTFKIVMDDKDKTRAKDFKTEKGGTHMYFVFKRKR